jgi:CBS domain-containing protein
VVRVGDVMSEDIMTITADAPLKEAAQVMVRAGVSGLPVVADDRKVIGIITEADFVTAEANRSWGRQRRRLLANFLGDSKPPNARIVADVMTLDPHTIDSGSSVTEAARKMTDLRVKRLPVVLPDGTLCGIISRADVMGVFTRPDGALSDEIENDVALGVLGFVPGDV